MNKDSLFKSFVCVIYFVAEVEFAFAQGMIWIDNDGTMTNEKGHEVRRGPGGVDVDIIDDSINPHTTSIDHRHSATETSGIEKRQTIINHLFDKGLIVGDKVHLRIIVVQKKTEADNIYRQLWQDGASFVDLAKANSIHSSWPDGGDIGEISIYDLDDNLLFALDTLIIPGYYSTVFQKGWQFAILNLVTGK
jgi:parvulin-like peptidyl-prolyl isomerase